LGERLQEVRAVDDVAFDPFGYVHDDLQDVLAEELRNERSDRGFSGVEQPGQHGLSTCPSWCRE
jgi:hypothetical protein